MTYKRKDTLYQRAKREGYRSRAAYKLLELQRRTRLLRRGDAVVDLGAWPGGWLQVAAEIVGPTGRVLGIDLAEIEALSASQVSTLRADVTDAALPAQALSLLGREADAVLVDLAPKLTGVAPRDEARAAELADAAVRFAGAVLRTGGTVVLKTFGGAGAEAIRSTLQRGFAKVRMLALEATRRESSERYLVGTGFGGRSPAIEERLAPEHGRE